MCSLARSFTGVKSDNESFLQVTKTEHADSISQLFLNPELYLLIGRFATLNSKVP